MIYISAVNNIPKSSPKIVEGSKSVSCDAKNRVIKITIKIGRRTSLIYLNRSILKYFK